MGAVRLGRTYIASPSFAGSEPTCWSYVSARQGIFSGEAGASAAVRVRAGRGPSLYATVSGAAHAFVWGSKQTVWGAYVELGGDAFGPVDRERLKAAQVVVLCLEEG